MPKTAKGYGRNGGNTVPRDDPAYYREYRARRDLPPSRPLQVCQRCGGPKERGARRHLCDECRAIPYKYQQDPDIARRAKLKKAYGITLEEFDEMLDAQDGRCAICRTDNPGTRRFHVDHDHDTGRVRGLLCHGCNTGIGNLHDDVSLLRAGIAYLEGH